MKTTQSGNGVKVANLFKVVSTIEGKTISSWLKYRIAKMKVSELLPFWNYKAESLNLDQARQKLIETISLRKTLHDAKIDFGKSQPIAAGRFLFLQKEKLNRIADFQKTYDTALPAQQCYGYGYGNYQYQCRTFKLVGTDTPFPITVRIQWTEDHDWNYYAKSYKKPKSTYSDRKLVFKTIEKLGRVVNLFEYNIDSFAGAFMEKAIAAFFGIEKVKCPKELKPIQLADYVTVKETKAINGYRLFERYIGSVLWDYAILNTHTGTTYHTYNQEQLVSGLRSKLQAKLDIESEEITKQTGYSLGFCETGMRNFCADNNVNFDGLYSRQDLRNIVVATRDINYLKYRIELRQIGITIGN